MDKYTENNYYPQETEDFDTSYERASSVETELRKTIQRQKKTMFRLMEKINRLRIICIVLLALLVIESFLWWGNSGSDTAVTPDGADAVVVTDNSAQSNDDGSSSSNGVSGQDDSRIDSIITTMTLEQKVYQMIFTTPENLTGVPAVTMAGDSSKTAMEKYPVGGLIYSSKNLETRQQVKEMLSKIQSYSNIGLFLAIEENGNASAVSSAQDVSLISVSSPSDIGSSNDIDLATKTYSTIAAEITELGFNLNLAPYAEPADRSADYFSSDATVASSMVKSSVEAMSKYNLASAIKYFPTNSNTSKSLEEMKENEIIPFKSGIDAGVDFVVVSGKTSSSGIPFSMSKSVMKQTLKTDLAFGGVVVADDITSEDIATTYTQEKAAVEAINSGADMLIVPQGVSKTVNAIIAAIESGEISETTINESVKRILRIKLNRGIQGR